jgi:glycosyltransferase involved in cell wall biosynthesis
MNTPLVSICLPNLNTRQFLPERMETILSQTVSDWELIICDSFSEDGAWEYFQKFKGDPRIHLHRVPRKGAYAGWNECLRRVRGEYIYIATSDDTMSSICLEKLLEPLVRLPEIGIATCDYETIDESSKPFTGRVPSSFIRDFFGEWMNIPCVRNGKTEFLLHANLGITYGSITSVLFRRTHLRKAGFFPTDQGAVGDVDWALRSSLVSDTAFVPGRLATWRVYSQQATQRLPLRIGTTTILRSLERILQDPNSDIPKAWKQIPDWDKKITQVARLEYYDGLGLFRGGAKRDLTQFLKTGWWSLWHEPTFLARQALQGFSWSPEFSPDRVAIARQLVSDFNAEWPPHRWDESFANRTADSTNSADSSFDSGRSLTDRRAQE